MADSSSPGVIATVREKVTAIVAAVMQWRPVRVVTHFTARRGPILGSGLAYQALFAGFAAIWVSFSIAGLILTDNIGLRQQLINGIATAIPGIVDTGNGGVIDPELLLNTGSFSLTAVIALAGLLFTALGWLDSARSSVRSLFGMPQVKSNIFLLKARDLAGGLALGLALIVSIALSVAATQATTWLLGLIGLDDSTSAGIAGRAITILSLFFLNAVILTGLYRLLAQLRIPWKILRNGVLIGALGITGLQVLSAFLVGGAARNPLVASFAVLAGLLIWFNLSCQVILLGASWIAVDVHDRGLVLDEELEKQRLIEARELVAKHAEPEPEKRGLIDRILGR
jgi:membrane protein